MQIKQSILLGVNFNGIEKHLALFLCFFIPFITQADKLL